MATSLPSKRRPSLTTFLTDPATEQQRKIRPVKSSPLFPQPQATADSKQKLQTNCSPLPSTVPSTVPSSCKGFIPAVDSYSTNSETGTSLAPSTGDDNLISEIVQLSNRGFKMMKKGAGASQSGGRAAVSNSFTTTMDATNNANNTHSTNTRPSTTGQGFGTTGSTFTINTIPDLSPNFHRGTNQSKAKESRLQATQSRILDVLLQGAQNNHVQDLRRSRENGDDSQSLTTVTKSNTTGKTHSTQPTQHGKTNHRDESKDLTYAIDYIVPSITTMSPQSIEYSMEGHYHQNDHLVHHQVVPPRPGELSRTVKNNMSCVDCSMNPNHKKNKKFKKSKNNSSYRWMVRSLQD